MPKEWIVWCLIGGMVAGLVWVRPIVCGVPVKSVVPFMPFEAWRSVNPPEA
jgi:hypothetical protein